jgi:hypothetical protein
MTAATTLDTFALIDAFGRDPDGAAQMIVGMDAAERADAIVTLLGLLSAVCERPDRDPAEVLAGYLVHARRV